MRDQSTEVIEAARFGELIGHCLDLPIRQWRRRHWQTPMAIILAVDPKDLKLLGKSLNLS